MIGLTTFFFLMITLSLGVFVFFLIRYARFSLTPASSIAEASAGPVRIKGSAIPKDKLIKSEFSNENCLYYKFTVREDLANGMPRIRYESEKGVPIIIRDNTGSIEIETDSTEFSLKKVKMKRAGGLTSPDEELKTLIDRHKIEKTMNNGVRAEEFILLADTPVIALGHLKLNPDGSRILSKDTRKVMITDKNDSEFAKSSLLFAFLGLIVSVIFICIFLGMKKPPETIKPPPSLQTIEYNDDFYD